DVIRVPAYRGVRAVSQMRAQRRTGIDRRANLLFGGGGMADRDAHAGCCRTADEFDRVSDLRRQRDQLDPISRNSLQLLKLVPICRADVLSGMGAARSVLSR